MIRASTRASLADIRRLIEASLPVRFDDHFYSRAYDERVGIRFLEFIRDEELLGVICWSDFEADRGSGYIYALAVDPACRDEGIGGKLLKAALSGVTENDVTLHVHAGNTDATRFYERLGFVQREIIPDLYRRLTPRAGILMVRPKRKSLFEDEFHVRGDWFPTSISRLKGGSFASVEEYVEFIDSIGCQSSMGHDDRVFC